MLTTPVPSSLTSVAGTIPLQIAFLVAFSQLVPAHTVTLFRGILSLRVPRFPLLYLVAVAALSLTPLLSAASTFLAFFSLLTSWTYLRFYKSAFPDLDASQGPSLRGDASETFAFSEFFPAPVKPAVAAVADAVFGVLVAVRICTPFSAADISARAAAAAASGGDGYHMHHGGHHGGHHGQRGGPGGTRAEAERRRALALRALDQRLHVAAANAATRSGGANAGASAAGPSAAATGGASNSSAPAPATTGPTVQTQPLSSTQATMTTTAASGGAGLLGETSYVPDHDSDKS